ncbi:MAG TPA: alcohol dehydrogenase, partial [Spirochaetota bacterium]|nr:alcohol dehydrogenase [Spirochaetota bacterium]
MMPFRKPLLRIFKTIMAKSMYLVPPQISTVEQGPGSVKKLPALIREKGFRKPLVVTDSILMKMNLLKGLFREFDAIGMEYAVY